MKNYVSVAMDRIKKECVFAQEVFKHRHDREYLCEHRDVILNTTGLASIVVGGGSGYVVGSLLGSSYHQLAGVSGMFLGGLLGTLAGVKIANWFDKHFDYYRYLEEKEAKEIEAIGKYLEEATVTELKATREELSMFLAEIKAEDERMPICTGANTVNKGNEVQPYIEGNLSENLKTSEDLINYLEDFLKNNMDR
ncbi:MAG: hypothetical protein V1870_05835 [Candidatus Aenigmatarchaeota archaeon]